MIEIDAASNNGVDDIRDLQERLRIPPQGANRKVYIVDEVHMLSKAAFNALLKTLEEPPPHVLFIFATTEPHKVLPTILSRCQRFDFRRITVPETVARLEEICAAEAIDADDALAPPHRPQRRRRPPRRALDLRPGRLALRHDAPLPRARRSARRRRDRPVLRRVGPRAARRPRRAARPRRDARAARLRPAGVPRRPRRALPRAATSPPRRSRPTSSKPTPPRASATSTPSTTSPSPTCSAR